MRQLLFLILITLIGPKLFAQCSSFKIVANKSNVCAPEIIKYRLLNSVSGSTYEWNVGNGVVYGSDTLFAFYTTPKTINATVKVTLSNGTVCNITENNIAVVNAKPVPRFSASTVSLCNGPDTIRLTDITSNSVSRSWVVDGSNYNSTGKSITHKFVSSGNKSISLIVIDTNGCAGVKEFIDTVEIFSNLNFDFDVNVKTGCIPQTSKFSITANPTGNFTKKYYWSFPGATDTSYSGLNPPSRVYNSIGSHKAGLRVELSNGCVYNILKNNYIRVGDTVNLNVVPSKTSYCSNEIVTLNQLNSPLVGKTTWSFSGIPVLDLGGTNYQKLLKCDTTGFLSLTISHNNFGCISTKTYNDIIEVNGVVADFTSTDYYHCEVPHIVHLKNLSDSMDASSLTYKWRILNGTSEIYTSTNEDDSFSFNSMPASYTVQLIANGDNGCIDTMTRMDFIYQDSLNLDFNAIPSIACVDQIIQMENSTKRSSYIGPDNFKWYFFDLDGTTILDSSELANPTISYADTGFYDILLIGQNGIGCRDTLLKSAAVHVTLIQSNFEISDTIICSGDSITLTSKSTPVNADFTHKWSFNQIGGPQNYTYTGDTVRAAPTRAGQYWAYYESSIQGGCNSRDSIPFYVNGVNIVLGIDSVTGCAPFTLKANPMVVANYYYGSNDSIYHFDWSLDHYDGVAIQDSSSSAATFNFAVNGDFVISLETSNSVGCIQEDTVVVDLVGVKANFIIDDNRVCLGDTLTISDLSYNGVTSSEWSLMPSGEILTPIEDSLKVYFELLTPGVYELVQIVTKDSNCFDTIKNPFEILKVEADFAAVDSFLNCAPVYAEFESYSSNADTLFWDFGDSSVNITTNNSAGHIYTKNTGWTEGYDIQLIAKNNEGCSDTARRDNYILVKGPLPEFEMINNKGCDPLEVTFIDRSIDGYSFFINYNDGSNLDSSRTDSILGVHTYRNETNKLIKTILPSMIVYDSLGCAAVYEPEEPVTVYKKPIPMPTFQNGTEFCPPFNFIFQDTGFFSTGWLWSIDSVLVSKKYIDSIQLSDVGFYTLELVSRNHYGCKDTLNQILEVFSVPSIEINISDTLCADKLITFNGVLSGSSAIQNFKWDFGDPGSAGNIDSSSLNPSFSYSSAGTKKVTLVAGLDNGCNDSLSKEFEIASADSIDPPQINYISFSDNFTVEINHEKSTYDRFSGYVLERSDAVQLQSADRNNTLQSDNFFSKPSYPMCYNLRVRDYCELDGLSSSSHCFIYLTSSSTNPFENVLEWTQYVGWTSVKEYNIFRKDENGVFIKLSTVPGDVTTYVDKDLCSIDYTYYVQAQHPIENWVSNSFSVEQKPQYEVNPIGSSIENVSVSDLNELSVSWNKSTFNRFGSYVLRKYRDDTTQLVSEVVLLDTFFTDNNVLTNEHSYIYRVTEKDICGIENLPNREGKSILLSGLYKDGCRLSWTPYVNWLTGVEFYNIEILKPTGFEFIIRNSNQDKDYTDTRFYPEIPGEHCYRVYGFNKEGDTSYSNTVCLFGDPEAVIPSAFSPNKDGLNETFKPIASFVQNGIISGSENFEFLIFNRWGQKVFESNDIFDGWDGTFNGSDCQQGAYIYTIKLKGLTNNMIYHAGTVTLLR